MIILKRVPAQRVAFSRGKGLDNFDSSARALRNALEESGAEIAGPLTGLFHDDPGECGEDAVRWEACFPVSGKSQHKEKTLPGLEVLCLECSLQGIGHAYERLFRECAGQGLRPLWPVREVFLSGEGLEVQVPVTPGP